jgi:hypothetical protein
MKLASSLLAVAFVLLGCWFVTALPLEFGC